MASIDFRTSFEANGIDEEYVTEFYVDGFVNRKNGKITISDVYLTDKHTGVEFTGKLNDEDEKELKKALEKVVDEAEDDGYWHDEYDYNEYDEDME